MTVPNTTLNEQKLERLFHFFKLSTCVFICPTIGQKTLEIMKATRNAGFSDYFAQVTHPAPGMSKTGPTNSLGTFNQHQTAKMKALKLPQMHIQGTLKYGDLQKSLADIGIFHGVSLAEVRKLAVAFYQSAFIFVMKGNFYLYTSQDCINFSIADSVHGPDAPSNLSAKSVQGQHFSLEFKEAPDGAITAQAMEAMVLEHVLTPAGMTTHDQAKVDLQVWAEFLRTKIDHGDYSSAKQAVGTISDLLDALAGQSR